MADLILQQGIDAGYAWPILDGDQPADLTGFADVVLVTPAGRPVQVVWAGAVLVDRVVSHG